PLSSWIPSRRRRCSVSSAQCSEDSASYIAGDAITAAIATLIGRVLVTRGIIAGARMLRAIIAAAGVAAGDQAAAVAAAANSAKADSSVGRAAA
ncbi:MAG: hypothetical protein AB7P48_09125, partial [Methylocystis sp.]